MGITTLLREFVRVPAANVVCLACLVCTARADPPQNEDIELAVVMERIDKTLAKYSEASVYHRVNGQFLPTDFGTPRFDWTSTQGTLSNPLSKPVRNLIFHAVCRQNEIALTKLHEVNKLVLFGLFGELQGLYVEDVAERLSLDLKFVNQHRQIDDVPETSLKRIDHERRLLAALENGKDDEALQLLPTFVRLCHQTKLERTR